jgi:hypothetical protein
MHLSDHAGGGDGGAVATVALELASSLKLSAFTFEAGAYAAGELSVYSANVTLVVGPTPTSTLRCSGWERCTSPASARRWWSSTSTAIPIAPS